MVLSPVGRPSLLRAALKRRWAAGLPACVSGLPPRSSISVLQLAYQFRKSRGISSDPGDCVSRSRSLYGPRRRAGQLGRRHHRVRVGRRRSTGSRLRRRTIGGTRGGLEREAAGDSIGGERPQGRKMSTQVPSEAPEKTMTDVSLDELGPVDYLVVEFPAGRATSPARWRKSCSRWSTPEPSA